MFLRDHTRRQVPTAVPPLPGAVQPGPAPRDDARSLGAMPEPRGKERMGPRARTRSPAAVPPGACSTNGTQVLPSGVHLKDC